MYYVHTTTYYYVCSRCWVYLGAIDDSPENATRAVGPRCERRGNEQKHGPWAPVGAEFIHSEWLTGWPAVRQLAIARRCAAIAAVPPTPRPTRCCPTLDYSLNAPVRLSACPPVRLSTCPPACRLHAAARRA